MIDVRRRRRRWRRPTAPSPAVPLFAADRYSAHSLTRIIAEVGGIEPTSGKVVSGVAYSPLEHLSAPFVDKEVGVPSGGRQPPATSRPAAHVFASSRSSGRAAYARRFMARLVAEKRRRPVDDAFSR